MRHVLRLLVVLLMLCVVPSETGTSASLYGNDALPGLSELLVHVGLDADLKEAEAGLESELQTQLELRLRMVGLKVQSIEHAMNAWEKTGKAVGHPGLILAVESVTETSGLAANSVTLQLVEPVCLDRDKSRVITGVTWIHGYFGLCSTADLRERLKEAALDCVDEFRNEWLAANPKRGSDAPTGEGN